MREKYNVVLLLIHPFAGGVAADAHIGLMVLHILGVFGDAGAQVRGGGAMPEGDGKETDADSDSRAYFGQVKRQTRRQVIGEMSQDAHAEQEGNDKYGQFNGSGGGVKEYFNGAALAKEYGATNIEEDQEACNPQRYRYKGIR